MKRITVLLADDHAIVREGLRALLETAGGFDIVGEAATGREAVTKTKQLRPAVVLMDIAMPQLNGLEATRQILLALPSTKILVLSAHSDDEYIARVAEVGAVGYLVKQNSADSLVQAIHEVEKGNRFFSPSIARRMRAGHLKATGTPGLGTRPRRQLTSREHEVLQLVAEGAPNKQVAADLGISIKTVEKHRQQLMDKLDIHDTAGLTRYAISAGVIESSVQVTII